MIFDLPKCVCLALYTNWELVYWPSPAKTLRSPIWTAYQAKSCPLEPEIWSQTCWLNLQILPPNPLAKFPLKSWVSIVIPPPTSPVWTRLFWLWCVLTLLYINEQGKESYGQPDLYYMNCKMASISVKYLKNNYWSQWSSSRYRVIVHFCPAEASSGI